MALDRQSIEKKDFPIGRRGYDPAAVDAHLAGLADEIEELKRSSRRRSESLAVSASEQVRAIVEAAETSASEIQNQAETDAREIRDEASSEARITREHATAEAREYVGNVAESTATMLQRLEAMQTEMSALFESLRSGSNRLGADLQLLDGNLGEVRDAVSPQTRFEPEAAVAPASAPEPPPAWAREVAPAPAREVAPAPAAEVAPAPAEEVAPAATPPAAVREPAQPMTSPAPEPTPAQPVTHPASEPDVFVEQAAPEPVGVAEVTAESVSVTESGPSEASAAEESVAEEPVAEEPAKEEAVTEEPVNERAVEEAVVVVTPPEADAIGAQMHESSMEDVNGRAEDTESARLVALNMALNRTPREEIDRYLAEHFRLTDRRRLLDEVYESLGD